MNLAAGVACMARIGGEIGIPHWPAADRRPAERLGQHGEPGAAEEALHRGAVLPQIERRIQVLRRIVAALRVQVGLEVQPPEGVQQVTLVGDALAHDRHVVVGGQGEAVLHRDHGGILRGVDGGQVTAESIVLKIGYLWTDDP
jgi:hypothetical protein